MRTMLDVPYAEKDQAKALGAKWNSAVKKWFIEDIEDLTPFMRWMPQNLKKPWDQRGKPTMKAGKTIVGANYVKTDCNCCPPWEVCEHSFQWAKDDELAIVAAAKEALR